MDEIDKNILKTLRYDARISLKNLSQSINLSLPATSERVKKLERSGVIKGYVTLLNPEKFHKEFACFCMVELSSHNVANDEIFAAFAKNHPDILECHRITGQYEYMLKIATTSAKGMEKILEAMKSKHVINTSTFTVLATHKEEVTIQPDHA
ncbi:MAG: Lrp/AsnC family transcriptional regulator [Clostridiales Family XIII bacterium]|jgi:Lrp/AsnC family leucine-responsive transcriptional regulator|nr:Lrp/AsnC family transcriptional regulator [Clostridiales Family XIII bacterium]